MASVIFDLLARDRASGPIREVGEAAEDTGGKAKALAGVLKASLAGAGVAAGAALSAGLLGAVSAQSATAKLQAQLGTTPDQARKFGKIAGDVYAGAYGDSLEQVQAAVVSIQQNIGEGSAAWTEQTTKDVLNLSATFDQEASSITAAVGQMLNTGMAKNSEEALNTIAAGFQNGANKADDFLDTLNEYGTQFRKLGIDGQTATGLISQGLRAGARDGDLVADAFKEFSIRAIDGSETTTKAYQDLGVSAKDFTAAVAGGGEGAREALGTILNKLRDVKDPAEQAAIATGLFGTQAEDLGAALFALDTDTAAKGLGDVTNATKEMDAALGETAEARLTAFKRSAQQNLTNFIGNEVVPRLVEWGSYMQGELPGALRLVEENSTLLKVALGILAGGFVAVKVAQAAVAVASGITTAAMFVQTATTYGLSYALKAGGTAAKVYAAAQWLVNMAMRANPIGLVITLLAGLVAGLVFAYKNSETFRKIVDNAFRAVATAGKFMWNNVLRPTFGFLVSGFLKVAEVIIEGAARAFGWVPGVGDKLRGAADEFRAFKDRVNATFDQIRDEEIDVVARTRIITQQRQATGRGLSATGDGYGLGRGIGDGPGVDLELKTKADLGRIPEKTRAWLKRVAEAEFRAGGMDGGLGGAGTAGMGFRAQMDVLRRQFPGLPLISGFRPGAITATGNPSYHGQGRAVDIPPSMEVFNWIRANFGSKTKELIFSPAGGAQVWNGRPHVYSGVTKAMHYDHIHWAMANGGVIKEPVIGIGQRTGQSYAFGERGPETVVPGEHSIGGKTLTVNVRALNDDSIARAVSRRIQTEMGDALAVAGIGAM